MKPNLTKAILGGLAGTVMMTMMMRFVAPLMLGHPMDIAGMLANMMGGVWAIGMAAHLMNGVVIFPLVYAFLVFRISLARLSSEASYGARCCGLLPRQW